MADQVRWLEGFPAMARLTVVTVTLADREDGGLRVYSDDLPGLILSGADKSIIASAIIPTIQAIFKHKGMGVTVRPTKPISEVLQSKSPRAMDVHVQQFVVELPELGQQHAAFPLPEGSVSLSFPADLSVASAQMMASFVKLLLEQAERQAKVREGILEEIPPMGNMEKVGGVWKPEGQ